MQPNESSTYRESGNWNYGLFGCFDDIPTCCLAWWLPCYAEGKIAEYYGNNKWHICLCAFCIGCNFLPTLRAKYRQEFNIPGTLVGDYVYGSCCHCCQLIQLKRELDDAYPSGVTVHNFHMKAATGGVVITQPNVKT